MKFFLEKARIGGGGVNKFILIKIFFRTISSKYCCFGQELYVTSKIPTEAPVGTTLQTILRFWFSNNSKFSKIKILNSDFEIFNECSSRVEMLLTPRPAANTV